MSEPLRDVVVKSAVKDAVALGGARLSSKAMPVLNGRVRELIGKAVYRASENGRKTVLPQDL